MRAIAAKPLSPHGGEMGDEMEWKEWSEEWFEGGEEGNENAIEAMEEDIGDFRIRSRGVDYINVPFSLPFYPLFLLY